MHPRKKAISLPANILQNIPQMLKALEENLKTMKTTILTLTQGLPQAANLQRKMDSVKLTAKMCQPDTITITITMATMDLTAIVITRTLSMGNLMVIPLNLVEAIKHVLNFKEKFRNAWMIQSSLGTQVKKNNIWAAVLL